MSRVSGFWVCFFVFKLLLRLGAYGRLSGILYGLFVGLWLLRFKGLLQLWNFGFRVQGWALGFRVLVGFLGFKVLGFNLFLCLGAEGGS